jgi:Tol biopolymer transport system component
VPSRAYQVPRISPDGRRIVSVRRTAPNPPLDLWIHDLVLGTLSRITFDSTATNRMVLGREAGIAPEGRHALARRGDERRWLAPPRILYTELRSLEVLPTRSGDTLITRELRSAENDRDILLLPLTSGGQAIPWAAGPRVQAEPALSPDGRWLAYTSEDSGTAEVYVRAVPGPGPRYQISVGGGGAARWNPRGGELFYLSADSVFTVPLRSLGNELAQGRRRALFANRFAQVNWHAPYDVAPDGSWFVFTGSTAAPTFGSFRLVLNWFEQPWTP